MWPQTVAGLGSRPTISARAQFAGLDASATADLARVVAAADPSLRQRVMQPIAAAGDGIVRWGDVVARQSDGTSCVGACAAMIAMSGNPALALWVATGDDIGGVASRLNARQPGAESIALDNDPGTRWRAVEQHFKQRATHRMSIRTWPTAWGVPPWGIARVLRYGTLTYRHHLINDLSDLVVRRVMTAALSAVQRGLPVMLYTGGDSSTRYRDAVPRHAVVLHELPTLGYRRADGLAIYEPSEGRVHSIAPEQLVHPGALTAAYGGWPHLTWAVIPDYRRTPGG